MNGRGEKRDGFLKKTMKKPHSVQALPRSETAWDRRRGSWEVRREKSMRGMEETRWSATSFGGSTMEWYEEGMGEESPLESLMKALMLPMSEA